MALKLHDKDESAPGKFIVEFLNIDGKYGVADIGLTFQQLEWIEDINSPCITGTLTLVDGMNLLSNLPIVEGDLIKGKFRLNPDDPWAPDYDPDGMIEIEVEIIKILEKQRLKQDIQTLSFLFVSSTWTDNLMNRVSKSWCQQPYTNAVQYIYDTYLCGGGLQRRLKTKPIDIEVSDEDFNFIIPNWSPYESINWLLGRSFVGDKVNYVFYEDKKSFRSKTLATLSKEESVADYFTGTQGEYLDESGREINEDTLLLRYHNLYDLYFVESQDVNAAVLNGLFPKRLITHDIVKKKCKDYTELGPESNHYKLDKPRTYQDDWSADSPMADDPLYMEDISDLMSKNPGNAGLAVYPLHFEQWTPMESSKPELWLRQHRAQKEHYEQVVMECFAPNNFTLKVGDNINVDITSPEWKHKSSNGSADIQKKDIRYNGKWMIVSLNRVFQGDGMSYLALRLVQNSRNIQSDHIWQPAEICYGEGRG